MRYHNSSVSRTVLGGDGLRRHATIMHTLTNPRTHIQTSLSKPPPTTNAGGGPLVFLSLVSEATTAVRVRPCCTAPSLSLSFRGADDFAVVALASHLLFFPRPQLMVVTGFAGGAVDERTTRSARLPGATASPFRILSSADVPCTVVALPRCSTALDHACG